MLLSLLPALGRERHEARKFYTFCAGKKGNVYTPRIVSGSILSDFPWGPLFSLHICFFKFPSFLGLSFSLSWIYRSRRGGLPERTGPKFLERLCKWEVKPHHTVHLPKVISPPASAPSWLRQQPALPIPPFPRKGKGKKGQAKNARQIKPWEKQHLPTRGQILLSNPGCRCCIRYAWQGPGSWNETQSAG